MTGGGRKSEVRGQRSEVRSQKSEVRSQRSEELIMIKSMSMSMSMRGAERRESLLTTHAAGGCAAATGGSA